MWCLPSAVVSASATGAGALSSVAGAAANIRMPLGKPVSGVHWDLFHAGNQ